mmetsp:Transcript_47688/g.153448  ORF Transcript_47688/g.153448 Transcript_47688/m.153448 type:complete len:108 (+) Transcript_47688:331-654(+)
MGPLLGEARRYVQALTLEAFESQVQHADEWSFSCAAKNTIREAVRYLALSNRAEVTPSKASPPNALLGALDPFALMCRLSAGNRALPADGNSGNRALPVIGILGEGL